jgi:hypothetical protein
VHHGAEREHVGAPVDRLGQALLGRHVRELALDGAAPGVGLPLVGLGDPEIDDLEDPLEGDDQVLRRDVAVDHVELLAVGAGPLVGVVQPAAGLRRQPDHDLGRDDAGRHALVGLARQLGERHAGQVLHHHVVAAVVLPELERLHDVRVIELRPEPRLVEEHADEVGVVGQVVEQALDHHVLLEAGLAGDAREVDLGGAADREQREDVVLAKPLADERAGLHRARGHRAKNTPRGRAACHSCQTWPLR